MGGALSPCLHRRATTATITRVSASEATDGILIEGVATRDREAFEELYHRYARSVLGLALRRIGDRGRAEDSVHGVFAAVWRSADTYDRRHGPGGAWLYAVARNAITDAERSRPAPATAGLPEATSTRSSPDEEAEASWNAWRVHRALETLPEQERTAIDLAYFSGLSRSEIADFLRVPSETVKTRTRSGLTRLADALERQL